MSRRAIYRTAGVVLALVALMAYGSTRQKSNDPGSAIGSSSTSASAPDPSSPATVVAVSMLEAFNTGDYSAFSVHFTDAFRSEFDEAAFEQWREPLMASIGLFQRIVDVTVKDVSGGEDNRHVFHASFDNDERVQFAIVFKPGTDRINRIELKPDR